MNRREWLVTVGGAAAAGALPAMRLDAADATSSTGPAKLARDADTFWEVYDPAQPLRSPYGDIHINSYCHAWSCTPAYLLRAGLLE
jgi:hypothetical protein